MDLESKIARFISDRFPIGSSEELRPDQSLFEAGLIDSVGIFELVSFLETEFGIDVPDEQIVPENFESVTAIAAFVKSRRETT